MSSRPFVGFALLTALSAGLAAGCAPPPPAPEGLDASTAYMVREFYADDASFQAGMQGFMEWYFEEGYLLVGEEVTLEETDAFTIGVLTEADVSHLPLNDEILLHAGRDEWGPRDLTRALGVVSLAEMECGVPAAEQLLLRPDQDVVFSGDWESYDRQYVTPRANFEAGSANADFDAVPDGIDPFAEDFDPAAFDSTLLFTVNQADPTQVLTSNLEPYELRLDFRHGVYDIGGEPTEAFAILTYNAAAVWGGQGSDGLVQSYSVEINVARPEGRTLRMLAVWAQPESNIDLPDSAILNFAVNKSLDSSNRISEICAGEIDIPPEE